MNLLVDLLTFLETEYRREYVEVRLISAAARLSNSNAQVQHQLAFLFLQKSTRLLGAICALSKLEFGEEAIVLARTLFEYSIRIAYIYSGDTESVVNERARAFAGKGLDDQTVMLRKLAELKAQGKCLDIIADLQSSATAQAPPSGTNKDWENSPNEQTMAKELGEPYECDWHFIYWGMSKIAHPNIINLIEADQNVPDSFGDHGRALFVAFNHHYRIAQIVCSQLGTCGQTLKRELDVKANKFLTLAKAIPSMANSTAQSRRKLSALQRLWMLLAALRLAVVAAFRAMKKHFR